MIRADAPPDDLPPLWLRLFTFALMGPAMGINGALVALAIPQLAPFGIPALVVAAAAGVVVGLWPARWLARRIHEGIRE